MSAPFRGAVGQVGAVARGTAVAHHLARDRRGRTVETSGYLRVGEPVCHPRGDLLAFGLGELADRIALLDYGKLIAEGTAEELKRLIPGGHIELKFANAHLLEAASRLVGAGVADLETLALQVPSDGSVRATRELLTLLDQHSIDVAEMSVHTPDLDDVFLTLTGQQKEEATR